MWHIYTSPDPWWHFWAEDPEEIFTTRFVYICQHMHPPPHLKTYPGLASSVLEPTAHTPSRFQLQWHHAGIMNAATVQIVSQWKQANWLYVGAVLEGWFISTPLPRSPSHMMSTVSARQTDLHSGWTFFSFCVHVHEGICIVTMTSDLTEHRKLCLWTKKKVDMWRWRNVFLMNECALKTSQDSRGLTLLEATH